MPRTITLPSVYLHTLENSQLFDLGQGEVMHEIPFTLCEVTIHAATDFLEGLSLCNVTIKIRCSATDFLEGICFGPNMSMLLLSSDPS